MLDDAFTALLSSTENGVLTTIKRDGRPQLSNVTYGFDPATATVRVSVTEDRAKARNLRRDPRVGMHVSAPDFWKWVVIEGIAQLTPPAGAVDDATVQELVDVYRSIRGEHPDWVEYREAMVAEQRVVVRFTVQHAYGQA